MSPESNRQQQRAQWHERIVAQSLSGLAMTEFCRERPPQPPLNVKPTQIKRAVSNFVAAA